MSEPQSARIEVSREELLAIVEKPTPSPEERAKLRDAIETLAALTRALESKRTSIARLRKMLFGAGTEKTSTVLDGARASEEGRNTGNASAKTLGNDKAGGKRKGHGRRHVDEYEGAERRCVKHESLAPGDRCPDCGKGNLYELSEPARVVRVRGQAPIAATVGELQRLRCSGCGKVFRAKTPAELAGPKYDETASAMIAVTKYGNGFPFTRFERMHRGFGIPLPTGTQWDLVNGHAADAVVAFDELIRQGAQCDVVHNDDTTAKILALLGTKGFGDETTETDASTADRTGVYTSAVVCTSEGRRIALYFTGRKNAGENLTTVLRQRAAELAAPIQMCDALSHNLPDKLATIVANCLAHARRRFVDVTHAFPAECRRVLETLRDVYRNDAICREKAMSADERLAFHQACSGPAMNALETWLREQFDEKKVEPNSGLGEAITYMSKHWHELTLFLRVPGAPLDNNIAERVLKKAILHRKNALFFKTQHGARVGDIFMSLIHTAELCGADPFDYLVALKRYANAVRAAPAEWMPWNYVETRERLSAAA